MLLTYVTHFATHRIKFHYLLHFQNISKQTETYWIVIKKIYFSKLVMELLSCPHAQGGEEGCKIDWVTWTRTRKKLTKCHFFFKVRSWYGQIKAKIDIILSPSKFQILGAI